MADKIRMIIKPTNTEREHFKNKKQKNSRMTCIPNKGGGGGVYLTLLHQNDSCIRTGSGESNFNVSLMVKAKIGRRCPQTITFEEKGEPKRNRDGVLSFCLPA